MRTRAQIKAELEVELSSNAPDLDKVAELSAELKRARGLRLRRQRERDVADMTSAGGGRAEKGLSASVAAVRGLTPEDEAALATWPPELRARLRDRALTRVILPWRN